MERNILDFLAAGPFVVPWFAFGIVAAAWVIYDEYTQNRNVNQALKWAWPIIVFFFSILGLVAYLATCRAPGIGEKEGEEAKQVHHAYVKPQWKKVVGSTAHCVGGDGHAARPGRGSLLGFRHVRAARGHRGHLSDELVVGVTRLEARHGLTLKRNFREVDSHLPEELCR